MSGNAARRSYGPLARCHTLGCTLPGFLVLEGDLPSHEPGVPIRGLRSRASPRRGAARTTVADFQVSLLSHVFLPVRSCGASRPTRALSRVLGSCEKEIQSFTVMVPAPRCRQGLLSPPTGSCALLGSWEPAQCRARHRQSTPERRSPGPSFCRSAHEATRSDHP